MKKNFLTPLILLSASLLTAADTASAQFKSTGKPNFKLFVETYVLSLLGKAIPVVASLALLVFFWGLAKFIFNANGDTKAIKDGKSLMFYGIIALFVMVSVWGILRFLYTDLGFPADRPFGIPFLPTS